jgi:hypothetical protein
MQSLGQKKYWMFRELCSLKMTEGIFLCRAEVLASLFYAYVFLWHGRGFFPV